MSRRDLLNAPCALLLLLALLSAGTALAEEDDNLLNAEGGIHLDNTQNDEGSAPVGIDYEDNDDPAVTQDGASGNGDVDDMDMSSYAQGMDASSFGSTGVGMTDEAATAAEEPAASGVDAAGVVPEPEQEADAQAEPADVEPEVESIPEPVAVPAPAAKVPAARATPPPTPSAGARRTLSSSSDEEATIVDDDSGDDVKSTSEGEGAGDAKLKDDLKEAEARRHALGRRAAEEEEVKAAEAAERARRDTGAPVEKEAPKSIHDYYKPKVLDPVYVGGYYQRAQTHNLWEGGKRRDRDETMMG